MTNNEQLILGALRAAVECFEFTDEKWGSVYLDNARPDGMSPRTFAGLLSSLERKGLYRPQGDDCFGYVLMKDKE